MPRSTTHHAPTLDTREASALVDRHLGASPRAEHSRRVAAIMRHLAALVAADPDLWAVVGLCHDLDYHATRAEPVRHGLLAAEWLADRLPEEALHAIAAHDHRSGIEDASLLADMLRMADALAVIEERYGTGALAGLGEAEPYTALRARLGERAYLADILEVSASRHGAAFADIAGLMEGWD